MTLAAVNGATHSSNKTLEVGATTLLVVKVELLGGAETAPKTKHPWMKSALAILSPP